MFYSIYDQKISTSFSNQVQTITETTKVQCFVSHCSEYPWNSAFIRYTSHTAWLGVWTDVLEPEKAQNKMWNETKPEVKYICGE